MRVDIHGHIVERSFYKRLESLPGVGVVRRQGGLGALTRNGRYWLPFKDAWFDQDEQLRDMDRKRIDMRILSLSTPSVYPFPAGQRVAVCREQNESIIAMVSRHPTRFRAFAILTLPDVDESILELQRVNKSPAIVGITIGSNLDGMALSDQALEPIWAKLNELRTPVFGHPMVPILGDAMDEFALTVRVRFMLDTSLAMSRMIYAGVFERYPNFLLSSPTRGTNFWDCWKGSIMAFGTTHSVSNTSPVSQANLRSNSTTIAARFSCPPS